MNGPINDYFCQFSGLHHDAQLECGGGGDCVIIRVLTQEYNGNVEFPRFLNLGPS